MHLFEFKCIVNLFFISGSCDPILAICYKTPKDTTYVCHLFRMYSRIYVRAGDYEGQKKKEAKEGITVLILSVIYSLKLFRLQQQGKFCIYDSSHQMSECHPVSIAKQMDFAS